MLLWHSTQHSAISTIHTYCSYALLLCIHTAGIDSEIINKNISFTSPRSEELIAIIDDVIYEGDSNEKFMVLASLTRGNEKVILQPSFIEISIRDNDIRPGISF